MTDATTAVSTEDRELVLTRLIDAPRENLYRAWTEPELLKQWFAPSPYTTPVAEMDVRPGGANLIVMRGPDGTEMPNRGVYLEVVKNEKLVFTDAYTKAWEPAQKPFMTVILTFEDEGGRRATPRACAIGPWRTARPMKTWASTKAGAYARTSLRPSPRSSDRNKAVERRLTRAKAAFRLSSRGIAFIPKCNVGKGRGDDDHDLRHQELRHDEEGAGMARPARRRLCLS